MLLLWPLQADVWQSMVSVCEVSTRRVVFGAISPSDKAGSCFQRAPGGPFRRNVERRWFPCADRLIAIFASECEARYVDEKMTRNALLVCSWLKGVAEGLQETVEQIMNSHYRHFFCYALASPGANFFHFFSINYKEHFAIVRHFSLGGDFRFGNATLLSQGNGNHSKASFCLLEKKSSSRKLLQRFDDELKRVAWECAFSLVLNREKSTTKYSNRLTVDSVNMRPAPMAIANLQETLATNTRSFIFAQAG